MKTKKRISVEKLKDLRGLMLGSENTGARLNDVCSWRKSNYNAADHRIEFRDSKTGKFHSIPIFPEFEAYIQTLPPSADPDPPLFRTLYLVQGSSVSSICALIRRVVTAAKVRTENRPATHRFFRRRAALLVGKENPLAAQKFLGHSQLSTTEIYMKDSAEGADEGLAILKKHAVAGKAMAHPAGVVLMDEKQLNFGEVVLKAK
jgi:integrase